MVDVIYNSHICQTDIFMLSNI